MLLLDHYLEVLARRTPARSPARTTRSGARARKHDGDGAGTRLVVEVLLLHRHLAHADVVAGLTAAVCVGSASPDVVAVEARKAAHARGARVTMPAAPGPEVQAPQSAVGRDRVVSLTERCLVDVRDRTPGDQLELPADGRQLRSVAQYDDLLAHPPTAGTRGA